MPSALFVVSECGYWGEECIEPLQTLTDAGFETTVATPTGEPPAVDERSVDPDEVGGETAAQVRDADGSDEGLNDPEPLGGVTADGYDAVVFPGGHGTEWGVTQDTHARRLLRNAVTGEDGTALVVCHAVGILAFTRGDGAKRPYWVEDEVRAAGANWNAELDADTSVSVDGDLVTARGPGSSAAAAERLLAELGIEA